MSARAPIAEGIQGIRMLGFRIHWHDKAVLQKLLKEDKISFQELMDAFVKAYMRGDRAAMQIVKGRLDLRGVPEKVSGQYTLSQRDRQKMLDEIENEVDSEEIVPTE